MTLSNLNRRSFLQLSAATGLTLGTGIHAFAKTPQPKRGGLLRIGHSGGATSDTIDPATYAAGPVVTAMLGGVCNNLVEIDADGNPVPELAESIEPSADAKTWTFKLRKVTFSNGKPLTADDVIASYNHHRSEDSKSGAKSLLAQIENIRADGDRVVVFELKSGNADFPYVAADYHLVIMPDNGNGKIDWEAGIGTGGYTLEEHEPGVRVRLKRRDDYWKEDRAWFDEVLLLTINDPTARQNALVTGEVDVINTVDVKTVHLLERRPGIETVEVTGTAHYTFPMHCDSAPFDDPNVRLALKHAIDRQEMVDKLLRGHGRVGNDHPIAPANRFFAKDLEQRVYDPEKAKHYMKKAGLDSLDVTLSTSEAAFNSAVDAAVLFQETASNAGININVKREPADGYWSNVWLKKPFCMSYWNGRPTEDWMFSLVYANDAKWNESHWQNERFNKLLMQARAELDESRRAEMYREMQILCRDDGGTIIPMFTNHIDGKNDKVAHGKVASNRFFDGWKIVERWWQA
ncbi:ABC transporter substrate-binding protein [Pseudovibrio exalbescens]|uniref:Peptide ABC transporter substrate-binding protein n=1 Tax=Pseudovibrio exalbescens TaxID=197461 RepID=A0A1U7JHT5_9HYPH|nr:ABC transporter substrate-binding protein [Pseudovibrio exalbescens]OKL44254.1 peptide ABC transporter substrate-binding protein [Pseudovibrio exalbescens]